MKGICGGRNYLKTQVSMIFVIRKVEFKTSIVNANFAMK